MTIQDATPKAGSVTDAPTTLRPPPPVARAIRSDIDERATDPGAGNGPVSTHEVVTVRCAVCLEVVTATGAACPECGEVFGAEASPPPPSSAAPWSGAPSIPDPGPQAGWFALHWRPLFTIGAISMLLFAGVALRKFAPFRSAPPGSERRPTTPVCGTPCWNGEGCSAGKCVWQKPNDIGHLPAEPVVSGPFALPKDVSDALPLDGERFAITLLRGTRVQSARTGEVIELLSDTPQSKRLYRVGDAIYATAPQRVYVIEPKSMRLTKTIEMGEPVGEIAVGATGRRAIASLPSSHAVAMIATEYHAEVDRIHFGDDAVLPVAIDDSGKRAVTTTGAVPLPGLRDVPGGAAYAFDPSRLASSQDRIRTSMLGNPVSMLLLPDGATGYVVLRADDQLVPLEWLPSGAVRRKDPIRTCREPEQIELNRRDRKALVRCNEGRAILVVDLTADKVEHVIPLNARAVDMAITPDGEQAIVALPDESRSAVAIISLTTREVTMLPLGAEPTRVRIAPDGQTALVLSERAKAVWVLR